LIKHCIIPFFTAKPKITVKIIIIVFCNKSIWTYTQQLSGAKTEQWGWSQKSPEPEHRLNISRAAFPNSFSHSDLDMIHCLPVSQLIAERQPTGLAASMVTASTSSGICLHHLTSSLPYEWAQDY
jgi:hypothetical protein